MTAAPPGCDPPTEYEFCIRGQLDSRWADWFEGMTVDHEGGTTILRGPVVDQAALHGILSTVRDLGLTLVSIQSLGHPHT